MNAAARIGVLRRLSIVACAGLLACGGGAEPAPGLAPLPPMTAAALRAVPMAATLDLPLQASVYAWRDFMPGASDTSTVHDLMVSVQVRGGVVPPKTLDCDAMYLVHADSVFAARPTEQRAGDGPGAVECLLRGAPEWPVGGELQVVIRVGAGAQRMLIRRETTIDATS